MLELSPIKDLTKYQPNPKLDFRFSNTVSIYDGDETFEASSAILAYRSPVLEKNIQEEPQIFFLDFADCSAGLYDCFTLLYGGSVELGFANVKPIYKFGALYDVVEMRRGVEQWIESGTDVTYFFKMLLQFQEYYSELGAAFQVGLNIKIKNNQMELFSTFEDDLYNMCRSTKEVDFLIKFIITKIDVGYINRTTEVLLKAFQHDFGDNILISNGAIIEGYQAIVDSDELKSVRVDKKLISCFFSSLNDQITTLAESRELVKLTSSFIGAVVKPDFTTLPLESAVQLTGRSPPKQDILDFCRESKLPPPYITEIVIEYIRQNKAVSQPADFDDLVEVLRGYCQQLPWEYSVVIQRQLERLLNIPEQDTTKVPADCGWWLFNEEQQNVMFTERPTLDEMSRYFGKDSSPLALCVQCRKHDRKCCSAKFQYLPQSVPHYAPDDNYHWYITCNAPYHQYSLVTGTTDELEDILKNAKLIVLRCTKYT